MNGDLPLIKQVEAVFQVADLSDVDVLICPPYPFLSAFSCTNFSLGGQNASQFDAGAHTGEVSAKMLKDLGCSYVILGHSERRAYNHESNYVVALKVEKALADGLTPVLCVGEPEDIRESGKLFDYIAAQLNAVIKQVGVAAFEKIVLAYEPIWAIGTGKTASPAQAQDVHRFIRAHLAKLNQLVADKILILYGGSVKAENARELFSQPDVDGGLIGGASLNPEEFLSICLAAKR